MGNNAEVDWNQAFENLLTEECPADIDGLKCNFNADCDSCWAKWWDDNK